MEAIYSDLKVIIGTLMDFESIKSRVEGLKNKEYHLRIKPENPKLSGDDGFIHEWIRVPINSTEDAVPVGSELFEWIKETEKVFPEISKIKLHEEIIQYLVQRKIEWSQKRIGRSFKGLPTRYYWVPNRKIEESNPL